MKIFLDVDGVLADFTGGACEVHGTENPYLQDPLGDAAGEWELADLLGLTDKEFWGPLQGARFWRELGLMPDAVDIFSTVKRAVGLDNICLLTTPSLDPESATGKIQWINMHFPDLARQCLIGACKHFCAHADSVLIDDNDKNVETFIEHGGGAILVPRAWNMNWPERHRAADYVQWCLREILDEQE